ncbi:mitochondrial outer membrane protein SLC25A46-like [Episyrphus balteatus]|uniref:mitochondrial outer membrane protein SLC25A46-like n=1 Tax=Episyrphus balteatus TaxID=286459 RepID=UPI0024867700|nr:mitochondrial outer membrane protein SLC25A46-like [Episyrphus balteatus]
MAGIQKYSALKYSADEERQMSAGHVPSRRIINNSAFPNDDGSAAFRYLAPGAAERPEMYQLDDQYSFIHSEDDDNSLNNRQHYSKRAERGSGLQDSLCSPVDNDTKYRYINTERDLSLSLDRHTDFRNFCDTPEDDLSVRKYLAVSVGVVSLITENLLSHPFIVLRRQCQVFHASEKYHLTPISLIPSIIHLHKRQGVTTLWKGLGSCLLVRGMSMGVDDLIAKLTTWPKDVDSRTSVKRFGQHLILKCVSIAVVMPFYAASLVETVQSDIASEKPGIFDVFREGGQRLLSWSSPQKGRMLPVWALLGPSVSLGLTKYIFSLFVRGISSHIIRRSIQNNQEQKGAKVKDDSLIIQNVQIYSNLISILTSEILFYPFETILHRLQLQGTRTIVDNLDSGYSVVAILTNYQGARDCYRTTIATEGISGLYKGFGAIVLQFAAHIAVIKITKWVVGQITEVISSKPPAKVVQYYNLDRAAASSSTTISRSLSSSSNIAGSVENVE